MNDLWPANLGGEDDLLPVTPALEQAELLGKHTMNLVKAEVKPLHAENEKFVFDFDLVVKTLEYRFNLFRLQYGVEGYPAYLIPYSKISSELELKKYWINGNQTPAELVKTKEEMMTALGLVLGCTTTRGILQTLISQAKKFKR